MPETVKESITRGCAWQANRLYDLANEHDRKNAGGRESARGLAGGPQAMTHHDSRGPGPAGPVADRSFEQATLIGTLVHLWPYIWPGDRVDLKMRVVLSVVLLLIAKVATLAVPFTFKWAIDALTGADTAPVQASNWALWLIVSPLIMTLSYGGLRVLMGVLTQWRDGIFARVAMHEVRKLAYLTFVHMHELSLRFHLERKTGGLTRVLERGRNGIETIVRMVILQLVPTIVEVTLLMAVLLWKFDWRYVLATLITVVIYMYYTYIATEWRIGIRRKMNDTPLGRDVGIEHVNHDRDQGGD